MFLLARQIVLDSFADQLDGVQLHWKGSCTTLSQMLRSTEWSFETATLTWKAWVLEVYDREVAGASLHCALLGQV